MAEEIKRGSRSKTKVVEDIVVTENTVDNEKKALENMILQMQQQMAKMQEKLNQAQSSNGVVINQNNDLTRTIKVISMLPHTYNLSTQPLGRGKVYTFEYFGDTKNVKYSDMLDILAISLHQFEKGYAVLGSKADYDDLGIGYVYEDVMSKEQVEKLVTLSDDNSVDIILDMEEDMQEKIVGVISRKIVEGESYDYNKIKALEDEGLQINDTVEMLKASNE